MLKQTSTRRSYLAGLGATVTAGVSGCLGLGSDDTVGLAYMPIFPDLQYFVMESEGYLAEIDVSLDTQEFTSGPSIVRAYGSGNVDIAMFGIVPAMIVIDRDLPAQVVAANIKEPMAILAHAEFQSLWADHQSGAFDRWADTHNGPLRIGTFPRGSVPEVLLRYWLADVVGVDPAAAVEVVELDGADAVFQAIVNDRVDGASIMEPVPSQVAATDVAISTFRTAAEIMPGQPAAVTLMHDRLREGSVGRQFVRQHQRATQFIRNNPEKTAEIVADGIGVPVAQAREALAGPLTTYVTDPREITNGTEIFAQFAYEGGQIDQQLSLDQIFDYDPYEAL